jgi:hypothetical protein
LAVFTDAATVVSGWFGDFVGGLFGAPPLPHRKVTLGGVLGDALGGCALGAASAGLLELITLLRPAGEILDMPVGEEPVPGGGIPSRGSIGTETRPGSGIFEANGGRAAAQKVFDQAAAGGTDVTPPGFGGPGGGHLVRLPDGSYVGIRYISSTRDPVVDFNGPGGPWRVHFGN